LRANFSVDMNLDERRVWSIILGNALYRSLRGDSNMWLVKALITQWLVGMQDSQ
jgi:hypothetical protein